MSEGKISVTFEQDHDRLDALFTTFQEQKRKDFAKAKEAFVAFKFGLQRPHCLGRRRVVSQVGGELRHGGRRVRRRL
jgi:hypothetical protein